MYSNYSFNCGFERDDDGGDDCDPPLPEHSRFRSMPTTPAGRPVGFPPHAKRRRPMYESDGYNPYFSPHEQEPRTPRYGHDSEIHSESQAEIMRTLKSLTERVGEVEKELKNRSPSSTSTPLAEDKKRIPTKLSVSL